MRCCLPVVLMAFLIGCAQRPEPAAAPTLLPPVDNGLVEREPDSCGATDLSYLIGQNEGMLRAVKTKGAYRVIPPGAIVTQEYDSFRLNIQVDENGTIERLTCG